MAGFQTALTILGAVQSQRRHSAQNAALAARQQADAQQLNLTRRIAERDKRNRLASLQATQRARFGAAGIGRGGSAQAVLNGLAEETERSIRDGRSQDRLRLQRGAASAAASRKISLIDHQTGQLGRFGKILPDIVNQISLLER